MITRKPSGKDYNGIKERIKGGMKRSVETIDKGNNV